MGRIATAVGALIPVAAATAAEAGNGQMAMDAPVIWHFLGYPFEAAGMIAALFGCFATRFWIGAGQQIRKEHRWTLDVPVSALALAVSACLDIMMRPAPFGSLLYGIGAGVLGEGIFKVAERYMDRALTAIGGATPPEPPAA